MKLLKGDKTVTSDGPIQTDIERGGWRLLILNALPWWYRGCMIHCPTPLQQMERRDKIGQILMLAFMSIMLSHQKRRPHAAKIFSRISSFLIRVDFNLLIKAWIHMLSHYCTGGKGGYFLPPLYAEICVHGASVVRANLLPLFALGIYFPSDPLAQLQLQAFRV